MIAEQVPVWVVDDQASFRRVAVEMLSAADGFVLAGECETGESAIETTWGDGSGIVLMDVNMPGIGGIEATRRIRAARPDLMILLMSTYDLKDLPSGVEDCGAAGYLRKEKLSPDLLMRLWRAHE
ncbi:response regulator [Mycobacterium conspicuum]|uniref:response regulator n=1 Tax=Mycobacterium conspicuum TaxID=44010 RepID=UPI001E304110|nr:response regulator transcription factor [Mycobacterium conspicuum]